MSTEKPILFSGAMPAKVRDGTKTQTRRVLKPQPHPDFLKRGVVAIVPQWPWQDGIRWFMADGLSELVKSPYGRPGDHLWVKEACWIWGQWARDGKTATGRDKWRFKAIGRQVRFDKPERTAKRGGCAGWVYRHARFMPRWACRTILEVTDVRVERVRDTTEEDAKAEGIDDLWLVQHQVGPPRKREFWYLWDSLNGPRGFGWDVNPWVWVISFKRVA